MPSADQLDNKTGADDEECATAVVKVVESVPGLACPLKLNLINEMDSPAARAVISDRDEPHARVFVHPSKAGER